MMSEDLMNYQEKIENALKIVVRNVLEQIAENGLPSQHHLYITFLTNHKHVEIAEHLRTRYPQEMTIVLQHQFWGLEVSESDFKITLKFSGQNERLLVPFNSIVGFADPSVNFALQFQPYKSASIEQAHLQNFDVKTDYPEKNILITGEADENKSKKSKGTGEVVTLDAFRNKNN
tara:strand:+ start:2621 stop:3145 length:525 start_codon:yes stop_codon:yes gene_type:complete